MVLVPMVMFVQQTAYLDSTARSVRRFVKDGAGVREFNGVRARCSTRALGEGKAAATGLGLIFMFWLAPAYAVLDESIAAAAQNLEPQVIQWRRDIHANPELSNREFRTSALVATHLRALGYDVRTNVAHTGVVGTLRGDRPGPVVALRADMDGLPLTEKTGLPFASQAKAIYEGREVGVMHACGHDAHTAILMGAAEVLAAHRAQIPGTVKVLFQPAEEGAPKGERGGAELMVEEGALRQPEVDAVFGLHVGQHGPVGTASYREKGFLAGAQRFDIEIIGQQTHGARPWMGVDPVVVGAQLVTGLQTVVSRQIDITLAPAVVTVGSFRAGVRNNIVAESAYLSGTIRTFDPRMREEISAKIRRLAESTAEAYGAKVRVEIEPGVPVTYNDALLTEQMLPTLERVFGPNRVLRSRRVTGAEDFAFYQREVPGFFFFIGARAPGVPASQAVSNHSPYFDIDEAALTPGVTVLAQLAVDFLYQQASQE